ncbi:MAG: cytochrome c oxidase subunit II [bacterium]|nr:cytochrome c oxidase subunit II [bacterium]
MKGSSSVYKYELMWILPSILLPVTMLGLLLYTTFGHGIHLPGVEGVIDPAKISQTAPFNKLGVFKVGDKQYKVHMMAGIWFYIPGQITVPVGSTVEFIATSKDVVHGLFIKGANINLMLLPGQVARAKALFDKPGEYPFLCHEYCGAAHHTMWGKVIVK